MTLVVIWAHEQLLGGGRCVVPAVVVIFVVIAVVSSSAFPVVCSLSRLSPSSLAGPGTRRSCRPCCCHPRCPRCPHCPSAGPPRCHCPCACRPLVLASSRLPVVVLIVPFLAVVVLVVLVVHCGRCRSFAFLVVVGAVLVISVVSAVAVCVGVIVLVVLVLSAVGVGVFVVGVAWPCSLCSVAIVILSGLGCWWCVSLRHPAVVAVVLPVSRGGGVVSGRWRRWGRFVCLPCRYPATWASWYLPGVS